MDFVVIVPQPSAFFAAKAALEAGFHLLDKPATFDLAAKELAT